MDIAHELTDEMLETAEKKITELYTVVQKDVEKQLIETLNKIETADTVAKRYANALKYNRLDSLKENLSSLIVNANDEAVDVMQGMWTNVYYENYNYGAYLLETGIDDIGLMNLIDKRAVSSIVTGELTPFSLMALDNVTDKAQVLRDLTSQLVTGISTGESNQNISKRIRTIVEKNYSQAMNIARTETTRIENNGRQDIFTYGEEKYNIEQEKEWVSTLDSRTRDTHQSADGQRVGLNEEFKVGTATGLYPGAMSEAKETCRCRCTMISHIKGVKDNINRMTYSEWKEVER